MTRLSYSSILSMPPEYQKKMMARFTLTFPQNSWAAEYSTRDLQWALEGGTLDPEIHSDVERIVELRRTVEQQSQGEEMKLQLKIDLTFESENLDVVLKVIERRTRSMVLGFEDATQDVSEAYVESVTSTMNSGNIEVTRLDFAP